MQIVKRFGIVLVCFITIACQAQSSNSNNQKISLKAPKGKAIAAFAEGCFWCSEHIFEAVVGID